MKTAFQILLLAAVVGLSYWLYTIIMTPVEFDKVKTVRETAIIERLKDIRKAQQAFKSANGRYVNSFDSLINFIENDSLIFTISYGSADDSVAVAEGRVRTEEVKFAVIDTIFNKGYDASQIRFIPFTDNVEFIMDATKITTESNIEIPIFEAKAPFKAYLIDLDEQILINTIDAAKTIDKYPGLKVGSLTQTTNDAGNWE